MSLIQNFGTSSGSHPAHYSTQWVLDPLSLEAESVWRKLANRGHQVPRLE